VSAALPNSTAANQVTIEKWVYGGEALARLDGRVLLAPFVLPGETVRLQPDAGSRDLASEHYLYSFFSTAGTISSFHSTDTTSTGQGAPTWVDWTAPAKNQEVRLWVVVRDGRGGIASADWTVTVR